MRNFIVSYHSSSNVFKGHIHVKAVTVSDAQDKFFNWVRQQPTYPHLWDLTFSMQEIVDSL